MDIYKEITNENFLQESISFIKSNIPAERANIFDFGVPYIFKDSLKKSRVIRFYDKENKKRYITVGITPAGFIGNYVDNTNYKDTAGVDVGFILVTSFNECEEVKYEFKMGQVYKIYLRNCTSIRNVADEQTMRPVVVTGYRKQHRAHWLGFDFEGGSNYGNTYGTDNGWLNQGGGGNGVGSTPSSPNEKIIEDTSITNHSKIKCIYDALMDAGLPNGLASILAKFQGETGYNVKIQIGEIPYMGQTVQTGSKGMSSKDITITIRSTEAYDPDYSRVYLAKTFVHEAFHAKLIQYAVEKFGTIEIEKWPKPINDATLSELMDYVENAAKGNGTWGTATHDWMVQHIDEMATSLKEFVTRYYPTNANEVLNIQDPLEPYRALMFMGLQTSQFYAEKVDASRNNKFENYRAELGRSNKNCPY